MVRRSSSGCNGWKTEIVRVWAVLKESLPYVCFYSLVFSPPASPSPSVLLEDRSPPTTFLIYPLSPHPRDKPLCHHIHLIPTLCLFLFSRLFSSTLCLSIRDSRRSLPTKFLIYPSSSLPHPGTNLFIIVIIFIFFFCRYSSSVSFLSSFLLQPLLLYQRFKEKSLTTKSSIPPSLPHPSDKPLHHPRHLHHLLLLLLCLCFYSLVFSPPVFASSSAVPGAPYGGRTTPSPPDSDPRHGGSQNCTHSAINIWWENKMFGFNGLKQSCNESRLSHNWKWPELIWNDLTSFSY